MANNLKAIDLEPVLQWIRNNTIDGISPARRMYHASAARAGLPAYSSLQRRNWTWPKLLAAAGVPPRATAKPVAILTNGHTNGAQHPISNLQSTMWDDPNILTTLDDEATDWWIGVAAGRHTWRTVPKRNRLDLVRYVLSFGPSDSVMTMATFDNIRPAWMPTAGTHTKTFNMTWEQLNDFTVEPEATR